MCEVMYMYTKVVRSWGGASGLRNNHYVIAKLSLTCTVQENKLLPVYLLSCQTNGFMGNGIFKFAFDTSHRGRLLYTYKQHHYTQKVV